MKLKINLEIDASDLIKVIKTASKLEDIDLYNKFSKIVELKSQLYNTLDDLDSLENKIKTEIDKRAKATIGKDWKFIKGNKFSITKSYTGSIYEINGEPDKEFTVTRITLDAGKVKEYREQHEGKLPKGVIFNPNRNSSIRIKLL